MYTYIFTQTPTRLHYPACLNMWVNILNPFADYAKVESRLNSDKVICGVLEGDFRLPEEESSEKDSDSMLERDYRPCRGGNSGQLLDLSTIW